MQSNSCEQEAVGKGGLLAYNLQQCMVILQYVEHSDLVMEIYRSVGLHKRNL